MRIAAGTVLISFDSSHQALVAEDIVQDNHYDARLVPTPESISAGCGLCLCIRSCDTELWRREIAMHNVKTSRWYKVIEQSSGFGYSKI